MASSGVNVLRYSALLSGVGYGFYHQSSLTAASKAHHIEADFRNQENLIQKAKAEWAKKTAPAGGDAGGGNAAAITDFNSPTFDLETLMTKVADGSIKA